MRKTTIGILLFTILLISNILTPAQQTKNIDRAHLKTYIDSLKQRKQELLIQKLASQKQIDSLKTVSKNLDENITHTKEDITNMYIKKFGEKDGSRIANKQVWKGMTDKMLRLSWGDPDKITKNVEKWGVFTQWYYGDVTFFFKNYKLIEWEEENKK